MRLVPSARMLSLLACHCPGPGGCWVVGSTAAGGCRDDGQQRAHAPPHRAIEHAVSARLAATPLAWPLRRCRCRLSQAVATAECAPAIHPAGGGVSMAPRSLTCRSLASDYWQGVHDGVRAYDLVLEPGESLDAGEDAGALQRDARPRRHGHDHAGRRGGACAPAGQGRPARSACPAVSCSEWSLARSAAAARCAAKRSLDAHHRAALRTACASGPGRHHHGGLERGEDAAGRKLEFGEGGSPDGRSPGCPCA
jgi:hypothetical protein